MTIQERIARQKEEVYQRCGECGGALNRMDVEDHAGSLLGLSEG